MKKSAHKDLEHPPGQITDWPPPRKLGDIIDRVRRSEDTEWKFPQARLLKLDGEQPVGEWKNNLRHAIHAWHHGEISWGDVQDLLEKLRQV